MYNYYHNHLPDSFNGMFTAFAQPNRTLNFIIPRSRLAYLDQFPTSFLPKIWNKELIHLKAAESLSIFKTKLTKKLLSQYPTDVRCGRAACRDCNA